MRPLISSILALLAAAQLPLAAMAASPFPLYEPAGFQDDAIARRASTVLGDLVATPTSIAPPPKYTGAPEPTTVGVADFLDGRALFYSTFTRPVDPESALSKSHLTIADVDIPLRLATPDDMESFHVRVVPPESCALTFVPVDGKPLPACAFGVFRVDAGVKALHSDLVTTKPDQRNVICPGRNMELMSSADMVAVPGQAWQFQFRLPPMAANIDNRKDDWYVIDTSRADSSMITVKPPIDDLKICSYFMGLVLAGDTKANTTYEVTFSGRLPGYGCVLGSDQTVKVKVGDYRPQLLQPVTSEAIISPDAKGRFIYPIYTTAAKSVIVSAISHDQFGALGASSKEMWKETIDVPQLALEGVQRTDLDLTKIVEKGIRNCSLYLALPSDSSPQCNVHVQFSKLGVTAIRDGFQRLTLFATDRKTGTIENDVSFRIADQQPILSTGGLLSGAALPSKAVPGFPDAGRFHVRAAKGADSVLLAVPSPSRFYGSGPEEALNIDKLEVAPVIHPPIIAGDETELTLHSKLPVSQSENDTTYWFWTVYPATFTPPGWSAFHFGGDLRPHSLCHELRRRSSRMSSKTAFDLTGNGSIKYKLTNIRAKQPLIVRARILHMYNQTGRDAFASTDLVHPASLTAGIKTQLKPKDSGYEVLVDSVVCDLSGKVVPTPLKISAFKRPALYQEIDESAAQPISSVTVNPSDGIMHSSLNVPTGEPVLLVATVSDSRKRSSRTTLFVPPEYCQIRDYKGLERKVESVGKRVGIVADKDNYATGEPATLWITSPFQKSRGVYVISSAKKCVSKKLELASTAGVLKLNIDPEMNGPVQCLVKLYDADPNAASTVEGEASAAIGMHSFNLGEVRRYNIDITCVAEKLKAGREEEVNVTVRDVGGKPVPGASITVESGQAYREALQPDEPAMTFSSALINTINEVSTDGYGPENIKAVSTRRKKSLPMGPQNVCSVRYGPELFRPLQEAKSDPHGTKTTATTDKDGRVNVKLAIPRGITNGAAYIKVTIKGNGEVVLGSQSIYVSCDSTQPASIPKANFHYAGDLCVCSSAALGEPLLRSWTDSPVPSQKTRTVPLGADDVPTIMSALLIEAQRMCQSEPDTLDNRSSRLITLNCLNNALAPTVSNKLHFAETIKHDYDIAMEKNCEYFAGHTWIEDVHESSNNPPFMKIHGLQAVSPQWTNAATVSGMFNRYDIHSIMDKPNFNLKPPTESAYDEVTSYFVFALSNLPRAGVPEEPNDYYRNQCLKRLAAPEYLKNLSVQSLSWLLLATHATPADKAIAERLKKELYSRNNLMVFDCNDAEKFLLRDTPLIKQAVLLSAFSTDKAPWAKEKAGVLALSLLNAINAKKLCSDQEVAFITVGLTDYCRSIGSTKTLSAADVKWKTSPASVKSVDNGINVRRVLQADSAGAHVYQSKDGAWHCKQGDRIKQVVTFAGGKPLDYVILRDYFAGGVEASETALAPASVYNRLESRNGPLAVDNWCQYQKLDKNGVTAYGGDLDTRRFTYEYKLSALAPGNYLMPAAEVSCPYNRRIFGTSGTDRLVIDP